MRIDRRGCHALALAVFGIMACGGDDMPGGQPPPGGMNNPPAMVSCPVDRRLGGFEVQYDAETRAVSGHVAERVPPGRVEVLVKESGGCRMLRRNNPFCDPPCGSGTVCVQGGTCAQEPKNLNVGAVTLGGLSKPVRMEPRPPTNEYFDSDLPDVLYQPGSEIRLDAAGSGEARAFSIRSTGIAPLSVNTTDWALAPGKGLALAWTLGTSGGASGKAGDPRLAVRVSVDQHGNSPVALECDLPDSGTATLGAPLVDELLSNGVSGYPSALLTRRAVAAVDVAGGCVDLQVISVSNHTLKVAGHTPCKRASDCPMGKTCDVAKESCR